MRHACASDSTARGYFPSSKADPLAESARAAEQGNAPKHDAAPSRCWRAVSRRVRTGYRFQSNAPADRHRSRTVGKRSTTFSPHAARRYGPHLADLRRAQSAHPRRTLACLLVRQEVSAQSAIGHLRRAPTIEGNMRTNSRDVIGNLRHGVALLLPFTLDVRRNRLQSCVA